MTYGVRIMKPELITTGRTPAAGWAEKHLQSNYANPGGSAIEGDDETLYGRSCLVEDFLT